MIFFLRGIVEGLVIVFVIFLIALLAFSIAEFLFRKGL